MFKQKEFEQSRKHGMDALVIGKGTDSVAKISPDARNSWKPTELL